ncbi:MAG TPA: hypothetical protein PKK62_12270 [Ornithinibacter sp.]|nr:hypothetical protein [Ornithinibacter sp.]
MTDAPMVDALRGRPADLPLIRQEFLERIQRLRAAAAPPEQIQAVIDDYEHFSAYDGR